MQSVSHLICLQIQCFWCSLLKTLALPIGKKWKKITNLFNISLVSPTHQWESKWRLLFKTSVSQMFLLRNKTAGISHVFPLEIQKRFQYVLNCVRFAKEAAINFPLGGHEVMHVAVNGIKRAAFYRYQTRKAFTSEHMFCCHFARKASHHKSSRLIALM